LPVVCELTSAAIVARRERLLPALAARATVREQTEDGCRFSFEANSDTLKLITQVIDAERQCCRWLSFTLTVAPDAAPIVLTLSGPTGAREFLAALFES